MEKNVRTLKRGLKFSFIALFSFLICSQGIMAALPQSQDLTVSGVVYDESNFPVPGVTVLVKGTTIGTITNIDGQYTITVPEQGSTLTFSFVGFATAEEVVTKSGNIDVILRNDVMGLDEVVVVGYGVQQKSHLTGSISRLKDDNLSYVPVTSLDQALQGKISGLSIQNTTSEAGVAPQIRVRGMGSISASNEPLVVVDGFPSDDGLAGVEMSDVESIEVLKDAASASIYGSRGANGVIIVTTKSGSAEKTKYTFNTYQGFKTNYKLHDIMDYKDYVMLNYEEGELRAADPDWYDHYRTNYASTNEKAEYLIETAINGATTDWQSEALRDVARVQNYQFNVSGGTEDARYFISANVNTDEGAMLHNEYNKYSLRAKLDANLSERVSVGVNMTPSYAYRERPGTNYTDFFRSRSWLPVVHTEATSELTGEPVGSYSHGRHYSSLYYSGTMPDGEELDALTSPWETGNNNPKSIMDNISRKLNEYRMISNSYINIDILEGLTFRASQGFMAKYSQNIEYTNFEAKSEGETNSSEYNTGLTTDLLSENTLNYIKDFESGHSFNFLLGATYQRTNYSSLDVMGKDFPNDDIYTLNKATSISVSDTESYEYTVALLSYLSRISYTFKDKYLLSASLRSDGSSLFADGNRWSYFPSVSVGWRASEERFMDGLGWIDQLKPRFSYGVTGNNNIEAYAYTDNLVPNDYPLGTDNNINIGLAPTADALGNPVITWERTFEFNYGIDLSMFNSRININADYYNSITDQLLLQQNAMAFTGHKTFWNNIGKIENNGLELELSTMNIKRRNFQWTSSINFATNTNKLVELGGEDYQINQGERGEQYISRVGDPSIQFYGYKTDGVWTSYDEIDATVIGYLSRQGQERLVGWDTGDNILRFIQIEFQELFLPRKRSMLELLLILKLMQMLYTKLLMMH